MRQLDPRLAALLAPQVRAPRIFQAAPYQPVGQAQQEAQVDAVAAPPAARPPVQAAPPAPPRRRSFMDSRAFRIADAVIGGDMTITEARDAQDAREAALREAQSRAELADRLQMDDQERLIFLTNPEAWAKAHATGLETRVVGHGDTVRTPGQADYQPGITPYDQRSLDDAKAKAEADRARIAAADEERARHNRAAEGVAAARESRVSGSSRSRSSPSRAPSRPAARNPWERYR